MKKLKINETLLAGIAALIIVCCIYIYAFKINEKSPENLSNSSNEYEDPLASLWYKASCNYDGGNVGWTECMITALDRIAAEREWKQRKLEGLKYPEINTEDMVTVLSEEQDKIRRWRENFENSRDLWCNANHSFVSGSGTPGGIAQCSIEFELLAIKDLNSLYYDIIYSKDNLYIIGSQGIKDFEPTKADIDLLVKNNKTNRRCVWAGESECE